LRRGLSVRIETGWGRRLLPGSAAVLAVALSSSPLLAQEPAGGVAEKSSTGREHEVRKGDTLWDLAKLYLSNPFLWGVIHEANRDLVKNPHLIYPRDRLLIPDGSFTAGLGAGGLQFGAGVAGELPGADRTLFYRAPAVGAGASGSGGSAVPTLVEGDAAEVLAVQPGEFLAASWLSERDELGAIGSVVRIVGHGEDRDKISQSVHPKDVIYVRRGGRTTPEVGDRLLLVREGRRVRGWGRVYAPRGVGVVEEIAKDVILVTVQEQFGTLGPGDLALPYTVFPGATGLAEPVEDGPEATLLGFEEEQPVYDYSDLGFVNLGGRSGVAIGDEFEAYLPERVSGGWTGPRLPEERVARLKVVRVAERTATVRVVGMSQSGLRSGLPVRLVRKMP
jgi:hypothetical protein